MATTTPAVRQAVSARGNNLGDRIFSIITAVAAAVIVAIVVLFAVVFITGSWDGITHNGLDFFTSFKWPVAEDQDYSTAKFGALNYIYGTVITSAIALLIGGLASLGAAIFLSEYAPTWLRAPLSFVVELLAAVPSIVYGFWGIQFLSGIMGGDNGIEHSLNAVFGWLPLFDNHITSSINGRSIKIQFNGRDILTASLVLSVMIIPTITSISRDVLRTASVRVCWRWARPSGKVFAGRYCRSVRAASSGRSFSVWAGRWAKPSPSPS
jgi:phosphate transport system permease protein